MAGPIDLTLLGGTAALDGDGRLRLGGCDVAGLADRFGTPLYVYDEDDLRNRCREYVRHFDGAVAYAGKAFLCLAMARLVAEEGLHLDVATGGELAVALAAGFPAGRVVLHGNNKSDAELRRALAAGVGRVVVDSFDEIDRIDALVAGGLPAPAVLVRVTPGVEAHTHEAIETGVEDSKFGFGLDTGEALAAARRLAAGGAARLVGVHAHIGSQVFRLDSYERTARRLADLLVAVEAETGTLLEEVNLGGGLGIRYVASDAAPSIAAYGAAVREGFEKALAASGASARPRLWVEPGRSVAGPAGLTIYRVGTIKRIPGVRTYVAVDGGMSDNPRPALYGAAYEAFDPARAAAERPLVATVAGKHCEQGDVLVRDAHLPGDLAVGDVLATPCTGAYASSMASTYNRVPRPAVVFVRAGEARVVVRRETEDDLLRLDVAGG